MSSGIFNKRPLTSVWEQQILPGFERYMTSYVQFRSLAVPSNDTTPVSDDQAPTLRSNEVVKYTSREYLDSFGKKGLD